MARGPLCPRFPLTALAALALAAPPLSAQTITFDELPAANDSRITVSEEYAALGVHFSTTDDGSTWHGLSAGDPGGWGLEGSRGSTFLGFDGRSYSLVVRFDLPVRELALDVARAAGSSRFMEFTLAGFREGQLREVVTGRFGGVNDWRTVSLSPEVDLVIWAGSGFPGDRYGVDNLRWTGPTPQVMEVAIDIKPGSERNPVNLGSRGVLTVALLGSEDIDVLGVDPESLSFGPGAAPPAHDHGPHYEDVDGDGLLDLLVHARVRDALLDPESPEACLRGEIDGLAFEGCDRVTLVPRGARSR